MFWSKKKIEEEKIKEPVMRIHYKSGSTQEIFFDNVELAKKFILAFQEDNFESFVEVVDVIEGYVVINAQEVNSIVISLPKETVSKEEFETAKKEGIEVESASS